MNHKLLTSSIAQRADGTWLFRTSGKIGVRNHHAGYVCSADGRTCAGCKATSRKRALRAIKSATSRVKKRARAR